MYKILVCLLLLVISLILPGTKYENKYIKPKINVQFFLETNDNVLEALRTYSEILCAQDTATNKSPEAWFSATRKCKDTIYIDDDSSNDGGWHAYALEANDAIQEMCIGKTDLYELCRYYK